MKAALEWQIACGADEAILDAPVDRTQTPEPAKEKPKAAPTEHVAPIEVDVVAVSKQAAAASGDLVTLRAAMDAYDH